MSKVVALQDGKVTITSQKVNLLETVEILVHDFKIIAEEKNLKLIYQKPDVQIYIQADPDRSRECLSNLISNAIKFTENGEVNISIKQDGEMAVVVIEDTGIGLKEEDKAGVFKLFNKANLSLASQEKGTGLGLYLSGKLAELQNGKIWLEKSTYGKGSTFCIAFPKVS